MTAPTEETAPESPAEPGRGWLPWVLEHWRTLLLLLLCVQLPLVVFNRFELPLGISFGYRSFARNVAIAMVLGVWLGARGLPRPRSSLTVPMVCLFVAMWLSVVVNGGRWADVRIFGFSVGLFYGARAIGGAGDGRRFLFHWLGVLVVMTVVAEVYRNPDILQFRESLRNTMVTAHPNTLGGFFALLAPIFLGGLDDRSCRRLGPFYAACAFVGALMTFSRLSLFGFFLGAGIVFLPGWLRRHPLRVVAVGAASAVLVVAVLLVMSSGRAEADWQRLRIIHASLTLFAENLPFGVGWGVENLEVVFPARYEEMFGTRLWLYHSHNMYVDVLVASGLVGAAAFLWFVARLGSVAVAAAQVGQGDPALRRVGRGFAATVVVFLWLGVGDMPLYHERLLFPLALAWGLMDAWVDRATAQTRPS